MHAYASVIRSAYKHVEVTRDQRAIVFLTGTKADPMIVDGSDFDDGMNILVPSAWWFAHQWAMFETWQDHRREGFIPEDTILLNHWKHNMTIYGTLKKHFSDRFVFALLALFAKFLGHWGVWQTPH